MHVSNIHSFATDLNILSQFSVNRNYGTIVPLFIVHNFVFKTVVKKILHKKSSVNFH